MSLPAVGDAFAPPATWPASRTYWGPPGIAPRIERLAEALDSRFRVPVLGWRFGVDALIGLVPVVGDALSAVYGAALVVEAVRLRLPLATIARMIANLATDALLGSLPVVGDAIDFVYKPNERNLRLLKAGLNNPRNHEERG